jgi:predicted pyridoxine 5'-phosphate oxidase superfamily flavin-nucleotide-binding protein
MAGMKHAADYFDRAIAEIIPAPSDRAFAKIRDRLCSQGMDFVRRAPFAMLATIGEWGVEVSQRGGEPASWKSKTSARC